MTPDYPGFFGSGRKNVDYTFLRPKHVSGWGFMKGLVFTEFMNLVEELFGEEMVDDLIDATEPESGGAYSAVGTYSHLELVAMVTALSERSGIPAPELVRKFGHHLASVFSTKFQEFFAEVDNTVGFLKRIDNHIHVEVAKLYPDAELPKFEFDDSHSDRFVLDYRSTRGLADLAQGLIEATAAYYGESFRIERTDSEQGGVHCSRFSLVKNS